VGTTRPPEVGCGSDPGTEPHAVLGVMTALFDSCMSGCFRESDGAGCGRWGSRGQCFAKKRGSGSPQGLPRIRARILQEVGAPVRITWERGAAAALGPVEAGLALYVHGAVAR
jgi:hypothetical protein